MLAAELIAKYIADTGTEAVFGVVGEGNLAIVTALTDLGVRYVATRREDAAVGMGDGWARRTGGVGVATSTTGPGLTNTLTALTEAVRAGTPLVLLTALVPPAALHNPQRVEARDHILATGAGWREARGAAFIADDVFHVFHRAAAEGRAQVLAVPQALLYEDVTGLLLDGRLPESISVVPPNDAGVTPDGRDIEAIVEAIAASKRPLIVAGRGASSPGAAGALEQLSNRIGAPLSTTLVANGLFDHPNAIGICGGLATDHGGELISSADLILAFGCSLNPFTTMNGELLADSVVIHCDRDRAAIGTWVHPDVAVVGDSQLVAEALVDGVEAASAWAPGPDDRAISETTSEQPFVTLDVARRLGALTAEADVVFALDAGHAVIDVIPHLRPRGRDRFVFSTHFGSVGLGIGVAMGATVASGDEWTVFVVGDGALAMSLQELDTIRRESLPIVVVVLDDGGYGAEVHYSAARGIPDTHSFIDSVPFVAVAEAMGFAAHQVETLDGMAIISDILSGPKRPTLVRIPIRSQPMNRWYQWFSALIEPARWTGFAAE